MATHCTYICGCRYMYPYLFVTFHFNFACTCEYGPFTLTMNGRNGNSIVMVKELANCRKETGYHSKTCMCTCTHTHMRTHAHAHAHTRLRTHTHTHSGDTWVINMYSVFHSVGCAPHTCPCILCGGCLTRSHELQSGADVQEVLSSIKVTGHTV